MPAELLAILAAIAPGLEFEGLTIAEWSELLSAIGAAAPELELLAKKVGPSLQKLFAKIIVKSTGKPLHLSIPGYAADGSVTDIGQ